MDTDLVPLKQSLSHLLAQHASPLSLKQIRTLLGCNKSQFWSVERVLIAMVQQGEVVRASHDTYALQQTTPLGIVSVSGGGAVFVRSEAGEEYRAEPADELGLMSGDTVRYWILPSGKAHIKAVVERAFHTIAGTVVAERNRFWLRAARKGVPNIHLAVEELAGAVEGDGVVAKITRYPEFRKMAEGSVLEILGKANDATVERMLVLEAYGLRRSFPDDVMAEAHAISTEVHQTLGREDFRHLLTCTIDGETARDFDDAISLETIQGGFRLGVHIADVAHYVPADSALDREAFARGTSVYFPAYCIPMLPEQLSNGICSLNPGEDRYAMSCLMDISPDGIVLDARITPSIIHSDRRFTYTAVQEILDGAASDLDFGTVLPRMATLAKNLRKRRFQQGSIDFDKPEMEIIVNDHGAPIDIRPAVRLFAHKMIEEFMLAANVCVARHLHFHGYPGIYRVHEEPDKAKLTQFAALIGRFGYRLKGKEFHSHELNRLMESSSSRPEGFIISTLLLRSMKRALYSAEPALHYGLAFSHYCHFTSPIRRYPDLMVHRILWATFQTSKQEQRLAKIAEQTEAIARQSSALERQAQEASYRMDAIKSVQFLRPFVGEEFDGIISGITGFGFFVQLKKYFIEGLVHISRLDDDHYTFDEERHELVGDRRKKRYCLGQGVRVQLVRANVEEVQLDFDLISAQRVQTTEPEFPSRKPKRVKKLPIPKPKAKKGAQGKGKPKPKS